MVRPDTVLTYTHFVLTKYKHYRVSRTEEEHNQVLVPKSCRETIFQAPHYNPMAGHLGYDKTLERIMARFYWLGGFAPNFQISFGWSCQISSFLRPSIVITMTHRPREWMLLHYNSGLQMCSSPAWLYFTHRAPFWNTPWYEVMALQVRCAWVLYPVTLLSFSWKDFYI